MNIRNIVSGGINKYKNMSAEKKSIIWYTICNIFQKGISVITIPIITRLLTSAEYGAYSVFISWRDIFIIFATLNLYCGVFTKILVDNQDKQDLCTSSLQGLGYFTSAVFAAIYFSFKNQINELLGVNTLMMVCMILYFFFYPSFSLWCTKQRVNNKYISMVTATMIVSFLTPTLSIILLMTTNMKTDAVVIGNSLIYIIAGIIFSIINISRGKKLFNKEYWAFSLKYNIPLIPHYLAIFVLGQSDRIMIKYFCGESEAGIYSLAYQISNMMNIVYNAINSAFIPKAYKHMKAGELDTLNRNTIKVLYLTCIMTFVPILIAPECVLIMGGKEYMEAIYILPPVCISVFVTFCYSFFCNVEFYFSKTKSIMLASTISAIINITLNALFIPKFGYIAAGYTTLIGYLFLFIFHYVLSVKIAKKEFNRPIYDGKKFFAIVFGVIALSIVMLATYKYNVIRFILLGILLLLIFIFRKSIIAIFKKA